MKQKIADLFLRGGVDREDFKRIFPEVMKNNRSSLIAFSTVGAVFSAVMLIFMLASGVNRDFIPVYILVFVVSAAVQILSLKLKNAGGSAMLLLIYAFLAVLLIFGMKLGLHSSLEISATFIALLLTIPALFCDRPLRMCVIIALAAACFIVMGGVRSRAYVAGLSEEDALIYAGIAETSLQNNTINAAVFGLISMIICTYTMSIKMKRYSLEGTIRRMAETDQLTGLRNRASYQQRLDKMAVLADRSFFCVYADANGLHEINNTQGHDAGDRMLRYVATVLGNTFGAENVYRVGGDEFVVLGSNTEEKTVEEMIGRSRVAVEAAGYHVAMGMTYRERSETDVDAMIRQAEAGMYADKEAYYASVGGRKPR